MLIKLKWPRSIGTQSGANVITFLKPLAIKGWRQTQQLRTAPPPFRPPTSGQLLIRTSIYKLAKLFAKLRWPHNFGPEDLRTGSLIII